MNCNWEYKGYDGSYHGNDYDRWKCVTCGETTVEREGNNPAHCIDPDYLREQSDRREYARLWKKYGGTEPK